MGIEKRTIKDRVIGKIFKIIMINRNGLEPVKPYILLATEFLEAQDLNKISNFMSIGLAQCIENDDIKNIKLFETVLFDTINLISNHYSTKGDEYAEKNKRNVAKSIAT